MLAMLMRFSQTVVSPLPTWSADAEFCVPYSLLHPGSCNWLLSRSSKFRTLCSALVEDVGCAVFVGQRALVPPFSSVPGSTWPKRAPCLPQNSGKTENYISFSPFPCSACRPADQPQPQTSRQVQFPSSVEISRQVQSPQRPRLFSSRRGVLQQPQTRHRRGLWGYVQSARDGETPAE